MRSIDADALAELLEREAEHHEADGLLERSYGVLDAYMDVLQAPTVHPEPPKMGKWIAVDSFSAFGGDEATWEAHGNPVAYYYCSVCKKQNYVDEFGEFILSNYCPDCGAKMEDADDSYN